MEMNKDEAVKCNEIAKKFLKTGNYPKAIKFFEKSLKLYPLPGVDALRDRAKRLQNEGSKPRSSTSSTNNPSSTSNSTNTSNSTTQKPYTQEQIRIVQRVRSCKTHYEVLGITTSADETEIKKAYRKLALKLHPDKNSAPGAEDAFKAVGKAFTVLSDDEKRRMYDLHGDDEDQPTASNASRRRRHEDEMSPEEIFNMFFGGGLNSHMYRSRRTNQQTGATSPNRGGIFGLLQLLPLFAVFFLSMFSYPTEQPLPFSFSRSQMYPVERFTQSRSVTPGIKYFVGRDFEYSYGRSWKELMRVEQKVEHHYIKRLDDRCRYQKSQQRRMIYQARNAPTEARKEELMRRALELEMEACDTLRSFQRHASF